MTTDELMLLIFSVLGVIVIATIALVLLYYTAQRHPLWIIIQQGESAILQRFGSFYAILQHGIHFTPWPVYALKRVRWTHTIEGQNGKEQTHTAEFDRLSVGQQIYDTPPISVRARDNILVLVNPVVYYRVTDIQAAMYGVNDLWTTMEQVCCVRTQHTIGICSFCDVQSACTERIGLLWCTNADAQVIRTSVVAWAASMTVDDIIRGSDSLKMYMKKHVGARLHDLGVTVDDIDIQDIQYPKELQAKNAEVEIKKRTQQAEMEMLAAQHRMALERAEQELAFAKKQAECQLRREEDARRVTQAAQETARQSEMEVLERQHRVALERAEQELVRANKEAECRLRREEDARRIAEAERETARLAFEARSRQQLAELVADEERLKRRIGMERMERDHQLTVDGNTERQRYSLESERYDALRKAGITAEHLIEERTVDALSGLARSGNVVLAPPTTNAFDFVGATFIKDAMDQLRNRVRGTVVAPRDTHA